MLLSSLYRPSLLLRTALLMLCLGLLLAALPTPVSATAAVSAPSLSARACVLMDADSGKVLYGRDQDVRLPMASTTKIMTALVVADRLPADQAICIDRRAVGIEGSSIYLYEGEWLTVEQLLLGLLLESANDAAVALALACCDSIDAFAALMNEKATALGLRDTHFVNPHGLDDEQHYTTAYELGIIASAALSHPLLREIMAKRRATIPLCDMQSPAEKEAPAGVPGSDHALPVGSRVLLNHNKMLRYYEGAIGVKTGYTKRSGRCLVSAACRDGLTLLAVTLDAPDDWNDHMQLLDYGYSLYSRITLCEKGAYVTHVPLSGGVQSYVVVTNPSACAITLPKARGSIVCRVELPRFVFAPIESGYTLGRLVFYCDTDLDGKQEYLDSVNLVTRYEVDRTPPPTIWTRILHFFKQFFN